MRVIAISGLLAASLTSAAAQAGPDNVLSAAELASCAGQAQTLRSQAPVLNQRADALDARRNDLAQRHAKLKAAGDQADYGTWTQYNADAARFNKDMADFRSAVRDINHVKRAYMHHCANRSYRSSDLQQLAEAQRQAMQAGMADVSVPYLEGETAGDTP